jgi:hypothetical protein
LKQNAELLAKNEQQALFDLQEKDAIKIKNSISSAQ